MGAFGDSYNGSFPLYNIPSWGNSTDNSTGGSYIGESLEDGGGRPMVYSNNSMFADWETLLEAVPIFDQNLGLCIERLNFTATGTEGVISGDTGNVSFFGTVVSYTENGEEKDILIPIGCIDDFLELNPVLQLQLRRTSYVDVDTFDSVPFSRKPLVANGQLHGESIKRSLQAEEECPLIDAIDAAIEANECPEGTVEVLLEGCVSEVESKYQMERQSLIIVRDAALAINLENRRDQLNELLIERSAKIAIAYARCLCSNSNDLDACLLEAFLDIVAEEAKERVELDAIFDAHDQEIIDSFEEVMEQACNSAQEDVAECVICIDVTVSPRPSETPSIAAITGEPSTTITGLPTFVQTNVPSNATFIPEGSAEPSQDTTTAPTVTPSDVNGTSTPTLGSTSVAPTKEVTMAPTEVLTNGPSLFERTGEPSATITSLPATTAPTVTPSDVNGTSIPTIGSTTVAPTNELTMTPTKVLSNEPSLFEGTIEPSSACSLIDSECCMDADCLIPTEICFKRTCIDQGFFRFTLYWEGDDDLVSIQQALAYIVQFLRLSPFYLGLVCRDTWGCSVILWKPI
jgi:hypothetical protein